MLIVTREFLFPSEVHVMIKLLPAFDVVLEVQDEFIEALVVHGGWSEIAREVKCCWVEKDKRSATKFAGDDGQSAVANVEITEWQFCGLGFGEGIEHDLANGHDHRLWERTGKSTADQA